MSDNFIRIIPTDPNYVPTETSQRELEIFLKTVSPLPESVHISTTTTVQFIDQGANFELIHCPLCNSLLDFGWWHKEMDNAFKKNFEDLQIQTPCCYSNTSLNDLDYHHPAGFSKFLIEIKNPTFSTLSKDQTRTIEKILQMKIRIIIAHY